MPLSLLLGYELPGLQSDLVLSPFNGLRERKAECMERHCLPSNGSKPEFPGQTIQLRELKKVDVVGRGELATTLMFSEFMGSKVY